MRRMHESLRGFGIVLAVLWLVLGIAALLYSQLQHIPTHVTLIVLPAFLVEAAFYLATGMEATRRRIERFGAALPIVIAASAVLPYAIYSVPAHLFSPQSFLVLFVLAGIGAAWYTMFGKSPAADLGLLVFMGSVYLLKVFPWAYRDPMPKMYLSTLGVLMWFRVAFIAVLAVR